MPTYDYRCAACGHELEVFQSMSEARKRTCPRCKKPKLERLIGRGAAILFKGGGFYQTDYRSDSYKKSESADTAGSEPKSESSSTAQDGAAAKSSEKSDGQSADNSTAKSVEKPAPKKHEKRVKREKPGD